MSGLRLLLYLMLAFIVWRVIQTTMRIMQNKNREPREDPFAKYTRKSSAPDFSNMKDADFEDITPKEGDDKPAPPDQPPPSS